MCYARTVPALPSDDASPYLQLISLAVHELRTPTSVVAGYLRLLQRDTTGSLTDRQRKMVDEAERSCQRLAELIGELSDIQKLDALRVDLNQQSFDLFPVLSDLANQVHEARDRDVRFEVRGEPDGASMRGDLTRLQLAFSAIFRAIVREAPAATVVVSDRQLRNDSPVPSAVVVVAAEHHVQAAYAADPGPFDDYRGGLGLALPYARRVIERHGGRLWSPAGDRGRGAAIVSLPCRS